MAKPLSRVPSFSGRPGFPNGLQVVLVERDAAARESLQRQLQMLSYEVAAFEDCATAASSVHDGSCYDILLVEAKLLAEDNREGRRLIDAAAALPFVLMSDKEASTSDVWRGIELGAADVLEKPLSLLKLRNIWQHVVRKMMDGGAVREGRDPFKVEMGMKGVGSSPSSPRTPSPPGSLSPLELADKGGKSAEEASFSGTGEARKESNTAGETAEAFATLATADSVGRRPAGQKPAGPGPTKAGTSPPGKKSRKAGEACKALASVANRPPLAIRPPAWAANPGLQPLGPTTGQGSVVVSQPWMPQQGGASSGCVWGTPAFGVASSPAVSPAGPWTVQSPSPVYSMPIGNMAASQASLHIQRCNSTMSSISALSTDSGGLDLARLDECLLDDVLLPAEGAFPLGDTPLDSPSCDSSPDLAQGLSFFDLDDAAAAPRVPPIGLALKKSASLLDLINSHLRGAAHIVAA